MTGAITFYVRSGTSPVPGAKVYINSPGMPIYQYIYKGYTSTYGVLSVPYLPAGTNRYMVSKIGYNVASGSTTVYDGRSVTVNVNMTISLSTIGSIGSLSIMSNPPGACVYINDSLQEMPTPVVINDMPEGDYVLTLVKEGYNDYITLITIVRGQTTTISTDLIPI